MFHRQVREDWTGFLEAKHDKGARVTNNASGERLVILSQTALSIKQC